MKPLPLLAALVALGCAQAPAQNNQSASPAAPAAAAEQQAIMDRIERDVRLPRNADPLSSYARSYAWQDQSHHKVLAYYESLTGDFRGMRRWVTERDFPGIADGGCGVVRFTYDVATGRIENLACNGYA